MHIQSLRIRNFRSIQDISVSLLGPGDAPDGTALANVNVLLGVNGAGKSSVLRAIALSVLAPVLERGAGFLADGLVRTLRAGTDAKAGVPCRAPLVATLDTAVWVDAQDGALGGDSASVALTMQAKVEQVGDSEVLQWIPPDDPHVAREVRELQDTRQTSAFFLVGYGATRRVEHDHDADPAQRFKTRAPRYERVAGLFEDHHSMVPLSAWWPAYATQNPGRGKQVINLMNRLLPESCRMHATGKNRGDTEAPGFSMHGVHVPFRALSDGYRAYIGWIGDMLYHLCMGAPSGRKLVDNRGVVLIDEIDLHLHPDWQRSLLPTLSRALPNIQFIVTTHSPLVVGSLQPQNLLVLDESDDDGAQCRRLPEQVHGRSAEQVLLSPYFGLASTRAPGVADRLEQLRRASEAGDLRAAADYLHLLSSGAL